MGHGRPPGGSPAPSPPRAYSAANRGQAAALWWGFKNARGTWFAMLDGDGQNPPAELTRLWPLRDSADLIADAALQFARENRDKPFFLYWPTTVPHVALQVPDDFDVVAWASGS